MHYESYREDGDRWQRLCAWQRTQKIARIALYLFIAFGLYWTVARALLTALQLHLFE